MAHVLRDTWEDLYKEKWGGIATQACHQHPAKFAKSLIFHIVDHAIAEGWLIPGQGTVLDPFAGVALGALPCALQGIQWVGCELESRFAALAHGAECQGDIAKHEACANAQEHGPHHIPGNLELWQRKYGDLPQWAIPQYVQGDSRCLKDVLREAGNCGPSRHQLGNTSGNTFWSASKTILQQTWDILIPGGHAIWVTGPYVRDGAIVDFPGDWQRLAESLGFVTLHIHEALKIDSHSARDLFGATSRMYHKEYKSFFRRTNERDGAPRIDAEIVLCMVKPLSAAPPMPPDEAWEQLPLVEVADCTVSSAPFCDSDGRKGGSDLYVHNQVRRGRNPANASSRAFETTTPYGKTDGQLGAMPVGRLDCALSSPTYAGKGEILGTHNGIDWTKTTGTGQRLTPGRRMQPYSTNVNNLGNMPEGHTP